MRVPDMQVSSRVEPYEVEFVDRGPERKKFQELVVQPSRCFFCIEARDGFGKTWLLRRLCLESRGMAEREITGLYIDLEKPEARDAEEFLRCIAKQVDDPLKSELAKAIDNIARRVNIEAQGDVNIDGDVIGGHKIVIDEVHGRKNISVTVNDPHGYARNVEQLTTALFSGLGKLQPSQQLILFLDNFGKNATKPTREWLLDTLAPELRSGRIQNMIVVLASNEPFQCFDEYDWKYAVVRYQLGGIPEDDVCEYWVGKRMLSDVHLPTILLLLKKKDYSPAEMSSLADAIDNSDDI